MKVTIGCDHGAYELKEEMVKYLGAKGIECKDVGTYSKDSVHYPVYAAAVCKDVQEKNCDYGILLCSTGIGMSMAANKYKGIRAALCGDTYSAKFTRLHNNANVLCIGALVTGTGLAKEIADIFLSTEFEGGRHQTRVDMVMEIEKL
jgi:ribose 5-phosphate isomerase B